MKAPLPRFSLAGLVLLPLGLAAQTAPQPSAAASGKQANTVEVVPARPADGAIPATGSNTRSMVSPEVRASLRDAAPPFVAPTAATPPPPPAPDPGPNNEIVRLPDVTVQAERPPVFKPRDLHSPRDRAQLTLRRYVGLNLTPFSFLNNLNAGIAQQMWEEEERLVKMRDSAATAEAFNRAGDKETSDYIKRTTNATFLRSPDFGSRPKQ